jgi:membrane-associated protein
MGIQVATTQSLIIGRLRRMSFINVTSALNSNYALVIIFAILAVETGLPLIIGLPGDTLLISVGLFASGVGVEPGHHHLNIWVVAIGAPLFAILGSAFGHWLGWHFGIKIFSRENSRFFDPNKIKSAEKYMTKYGTGRAIVFGRFIPVVRGLINPLSGIVRVPFKTFAFWNVVGALLWTESLIWGAYAAGTTFADSISKYLTYIILVIAGVTVIPLVWEVFKEWRTRKHLS